MKPNVYKELPQPDGTIAIYSTDANGKRLPTRYVKSGGAPTTTEPRRVEPKRSRLRKAAQFAKSAARHVREGMPQATDEQVAERFAICKACPYFIPKEEGAGECSKCGCGLKAVGVSGLNKLRWSGESCPAKRWGPIPLPPAQAGE